MPQKRVVYQEVEKKVKEIICKQLECEAGEVRLDVSLYVMGADSMDIIEITTYAENWICDEYGVPGTFDNDEVDQYTTVQKLIGHIIATIRRAIKDSRKARKTAKK